ncbi:hypothetical protein EPYR_00618 [Erwinia pyrifoliae DSM 12163]|nr:hypothetical protein EPYR_00618 [Erwinia pyrifoliae DSM 12163]
MNRFVLTIETVYFVVFKSSCMCVNSIGFIFLNTMMSFTIFYAPI